MTGRVFAAHQPNLLPWLGFFAKAAQAHSFVLMGGVQLPGREARLAKRVQLADRRLTFPIRRPNGLHTTYNDAVWADGTAATMIDLLNYIGSMETRENHIQVEWLREALDGAYGPTPEGRSVGTSNAAFILMTFDLLDLPLAASDYTDVPDGKEPNERLACWTEEAGCTEYLSGRGAAKGYLDPAPFQDRGLQVRVNDWTLPSRFPGGLEGCSIVEWLLRYPLEEVREALRLPEAP